ncbi:hypothetical protein PGIGA_G00209460 [Pangasianodon gigas]|uniref:Uncharacterized protein n=1 Tax=Pangasianodon gigas TaxID=30993 RepID=A0ACC5WFS6_PANGG|nr:hypothetical protein [Pangasianodon gigas]
MAVILQIRHHLEDGEEAAVSSPKRMNYQPGLVIFTLKHSLQSFTDHRFDRVKKIKALSCVSI